MGGTQSNMKYKFSKDTTTSLYTLSGNEIAGAMDLRSHFDMPNMKYCEGLASSPAIVVVYSYMSACSISKRMSAVPSILDVFQRSCGENDCTNIHDCASQLGMGLVCTETEWPYDENCVLNDSPKSPDPRDEQPNYVPITLERVRLTENDICDCLSSRRVVMCAMKMTSRILEDDTFEEDDDICGDCAVCIVGYNIHDRVFTLWCPYLNRYMFLSFDFVLNTDYCTDAYTITLSEKDECEKPLFM